MAVLVAPQATADIFRGEKQVNSKDKLQFKKIKEYLCLKLSPHWMQCFPPSEFTGSKLGVIPMILSDQL